MDKCGMCQYSQTQGKELVCTNEESEMYGLETDYNENCPDYEEIIVRRF